jgi:hypothetical protein
MAESDITNIIAKLQWCCRAMIYEEMLQKMERMSEKKAWKKLGRYVKEGRYTAFNSLRQVMHLASGIAYSVSGLGLRCTEKLSEKSIDLDLDAVIYGFI